MLWAIEINLWDYNWVHTHIPCIYFCIYEYIYVSICIKIAYRLNFKMTKVKNGKRKINESSSLELKKNMLIQQNNPNYQRNGKQHK